MCKQCSVHLWETEININIIMTVACMLCYNYAACMRMSPCKDPLKKILQWCSFPPSSLWRVCYNKIEVNLPLWFLWGLLEHPVILHYFASLWEMVVHRPRLSLPVARKFYPLGFQFWGAFHYAVRPCLDSPHVPVRAELVERAGGRVASTCPDPDGPR